jgi:drug/metabolite transporter (DMT)-like permease
VRRVARAGLATSQDASRRVHVDLFGTALIAAASVQLGAIVIIAKLLTEKTLPVPFLLAFRFVVAAIVMAVLLSWRKEPLLAAHRERVALIGIGTLGYGLAALLFFLSLRYGPTSTLALIVYSYPIFVVIGSVLLGQGLPARLVVTAIVVGFCGVVFIVWTPGGGVAVRPLGVLLALLGAVAYAGYLTGGGRLVHRTGYMTASLWTSGSAGVALVVFTVSTGAARMPAGSQWVMLFGISLLTASAFYCLFRGLRRLGSVKVAALGTVEPLSTAALAIIILHDQPTLGFAIGTPLIIAGAVTASFARARPHRQKAPPQGLDARTP